MDNDSKKKNSFIICILIILLLVTVGYIVYDKFLKDDKTIKTSTNSESSSSENESIKTNEITTLKRIQITDVNQIANVDGKEFRIKKEISVDGAYLLINDSIVDAGGETTAYADFAYVTNKYIIFTIITQEAESISYAINKEGNEILVDDVNKDSNKTGEDTRQYQIHDLKIVDGILHTSGHVFCGLDVECIDKDLIIKYENNKITVIPVNLN